MRTYGILAGLTAAAIWGGMYVVSKVVLEFIPPFTLLTLRLVLGAAVLGTVLLVRRRTMGSRRSILRVLGVGVVGYGVSVGLQFVGTALSSAAHAALITSAAPVFILLFGILLLGEPASAQRIGALVMASLGVVAVLSPTSASLAGGSFIGNIALVGAAVTWGLYSVLVKRVSRVRTTTEVSFLALLGGLLVSLPLTAAEGVGIAPAARFPAILLGVVYLGLVSTALATYLWNRSLAILEAGLVSILFFAQPVVGVALASWVLGEVLGPSFWLGAVLISIGLILSAFPAGGDRRESAEPHPAVSDPGGQSR